MAPVNLKKIFLPALIYALVRSRINPQVKETVAETEYDYVIVGSGWSGSVLANRLSADANIKVLLLEAGTKDNVSTEIPLLTLGLHGGGFDWKYKSVPQERACWGNPGKQCHIASGKVAGGSSILDVLIYGRAADEDFNELSKTVPGWSSQDVLPYFKKFEDFHNWDGKCIENERHHCGGEVYIGPLAPDSIGETTEYFLQGGKELLGLKDSYDINEEPGIGHSLFFMKNGIRWGAATAYLKSISWERPNLHISLESFAHRIVIDAQSKTATGIVYEKDGEKFLVKAKKEVILSAGVFQSPKILMLSGIGPQDELEKHNIPVLVNLPGVGKNYKEMVAASIALTTEEDMTPERMNSLTTSKVRLWAQGKDALTSPSGLDALATFRSSLADQNTTAPDLALIYQSLELHAISAPFLQKSLGFDDEHWNQLLEPLKNKQMVNIQVNLLRPKSSGTVTLRSINPKDDPVIDPNYYSDEDDLRKLSEGIRTSQKFSNTSLFRQHGYKLSPYTFDECKHISDRQSDEYLTCFLRYGTLIRWCGVGTNKMGPQEDTMSVVDESLRVRGMSKLRIVDASVLPTHMGGPPASTVIMVAEKTADMIIKDNQ